MHVKMEKQLCPGLEHQGPIMAALNATSLCTAVFTGHFCQRLNCPVAGGVGRVATRGDGMHHLDCARKSHPTSENRKSVLRTLVRIKFYNLYALNYALISPD